MRKRDLPFAAGVAAFAAGGIVATPAAAYLTLNEDSGGEGCDHGSDASINISLVSSPALNAEEISYMTWGAAAWNSNQPAVFPVFVNTSGTKDLFVHAFKDVTAPDAARTTDAHDPDWVPECNGNVWVASHIYWNRQNPPTSSAIGRAVASHEMGHSVGLHHYDSPLYPCDPFKEGIMRADSGVIDCGWTTPQFDDLLGAISLY